MQPIYLYGNNVGASCNASSMTGTITVTPGAAMSLATGSDPQQVCKGEVITGNVTVERYVPPRRAWRFMAVPFGSSTQTIKDAWQEGANNTDPTLNYANNQDPHPGFWYAYNR